MFSLAHSLVSFFTLFCCHHFTMNLFFQKHQLSLLCTVAQSCLTLCDPMDYIALGSSVHGIFQARILE